MSCGQPVGRPESRPRRYDANVTPPRARAGTTAPRAPARPAAPMSVVCVRALVACHGWAFPRRSRDSSGISALKGARCQRLTLPRSWLSLVKRRRWPGPRRGCKGYAPREVRWLGAESRKWMQRAPLSSQTLPRMSSVVGGAHGSMERRSSLMARDRSQMYTISLSLLAALYSFPRIRGPRQ